MRNDGIAACLLLFFSGLVHAGAQPAEMPANFHWIDLHRDAPTVQRVEQALSSAKQNYTALREIGVIEHPALVFTTNREADAPTTDYDQWEIDSVDLETLHVSPVLGGFQVRMEAWVRFTKSRGPELVVTYKNCWECEPETLLTSLFWRASSGWQARWPNQKFPDTPGAVLITTDIGDPYTDDVDIAQTYALDSSSDKPASLLVLFHSKDSSTRKITTDLFRYSVDQSDKEKVEEVKGSSWPRALREVCDPRQATLAAGQDAPYCQRLRQRAHPAH
ncbi:MAG: hypothetical protein WA294_02645 [Acidobacteriaceae bacterium]